MYIREPERKDKERMTNLQIQQTDDGSHTLYWPEKNEHYHSVHGSVQEARKVYVETALVPAMDACMSAGTDTVQVFEMGLGTALNACLTLQEAEKRHMKVAYTAIEAFPLPEDVWRRLNYPQALGIESRVFEAFHRQAFDAREHALSPYFSLTKIQAEMQAAVLPGKRFHAVYYDAFAPSVQPELWEPGIFVKLRQACTTPCFLGTYCAQGRFRRNLRSAGFAVESLPGPKGKREITRGIVLS